VSLNARNTMLTDLDLTQTNLQYLNISNNQDLQTLDLKNGNNTSISYYNTSNTPNLSCINVDDKDYADANWTNKDAANEFSEDCAFLSVDDASIEATVTVSPNPFTTSISIDLNGNTQFIQASLYNIIGKEVLRTTSSTINTSNLGSGVYILAIKTNKGTLTRKVIKK